LQRPSQFTFILSLIVFLPLSLLSSAAFYPFGTDPYLKGKGIFIIRHSLHLLDPICQLDHVPPESRIDLGSTNIIDQQQPIALATHKTCH
jgi:hypothetical protein